MNKWNQKRKTMQRYDLTAEMYDARYTTEQAAKYKVALERLNIIRHDQVLDVGCGTGLLFNRVASEAQAVVGVDLSAKLLRQAKERARNFHNVHLVQADADNLPFKDGHFNVVFAFTVLQNIPKPLETLGEIKRIANCSALFVVTGLKKVFPLEAFQVLLQNAGLQVVSLEDSDTLKCYVAVTVRKSRV